MKIALLLVAILCLSGCDDKPSLKDYYTAHPEAFAALPTATQVAIVCDTSITYLALGAALCLAQGIYNSRK